MGFSDPQGPKVWRVARYLVAVFALLFAIFGPLEGVPATMLGLSAFGLFNLLGLLGFWQQARRNVELECGPGYIQIRKAGTRNQRIVAKDITGGTTARMSTGVLLTLQHRLRIDPITLELENDGDVEKVRHALGIGHGGFGVVAWRTHRDTNQRSAFVGRILAVTTTFLTIAATLAISTTAGLIVGFMFGIFGFIGAILGLAGLLSRPGEPNIVMTAAGLRLRTPFGWFALPYEALQHVEAQPGKLFFKVPPPYHSVVVERSLPAAGGPSESERRTIVAQIRAASERARGMGPHKDDVTGRVDVLRRNGESPREWLVRLDMAGQMLSAGAGYRGNTLDAQDLWAILEDPEAEADLRAAAARVLRHSPAPDTRVRIDSALAAVRDESTNQRLRIAIQDDLDAASQELAFLDATAVPRHHAGRR